MIPGCPHTTIRHVLIFPVLRDPVKSQQGYYPVPPHGHLLAGSARKPAGLGRKARPKGDHSPSRMGLASRTCCSIHECWPLTVARNCRMSLVVSVFPAPDSPLQRGHSRCQSIKQPFLQYPQLCKSTTGPLSGLDRDTPSLCHISPVGLSCLLCISYWCVHLFCPALDARSWSMVVSGLFQCHGLSAQ